MTFDATLITPAAPMDIIGSVSDLTPGSNPTLVKIGGGNVVLSGANSYGGKTDVQEGALVVHNPQALGASGAAHPYDDAAGIHDVGEAAEQSGEIVEIENAAEIGGQIGGGLQYR